MNATKKALISTLVGGMAFAVGSDAQAASYSDTVLAQNPDGYWRMNETSGTSLANEVVGGTTGVVNSSTVVTLGVAGPRPTDRLAGFESGNTSIGYSSNQSSLTNSFTPASPTPMSAAQGSVSFWFRSDGGSNQMLYYGFTGDSDANGFGGSGESELHVHIGGGGNNGTLGGIGLYIDGSTAVNISSTGTYNDNEWHHVVATWDNTATAVYIDGGSLAGGETVTGGASTGTFTYTGSQSRFGKPRANNVRKFVGEGDELAVWTTALSASDAQAQYLAAVPEPGSLALLGLGGLCMLKRRRRS